jgi:hypothetical protein
LTSLSSALTCRSQFVSWRSGRRPLRRSSTRSGLLPTLRIVSRNRAAVPCLTGLDYRRRRGSEARRRFGRSISSVYPARNLGTFPPAK